MLMHILFFSFLFFFYLEVAAHNRIRRNAWRMDRIWHTIQIKTASLFRP